VEKSPHLNLATQFLMVAHDGVFLSEWRVFPWRLAFQEKKNLMTARVLMLLKSRASPYMLPFSLCNKTCNSVHEQTPLSNDTTDSVL
jgi:hypothetical protein